MFETCQPTRSTQTDRQEAGKRARGRQESRVHFSFVSQLVGRDLEGCARINCNVNVILQPNSTNAQVREPLASCSPHLAHRISLKSYPIRAIGNECTSCRSLTLAVTQPRLEKSISLHHPPIKMSPSFTLVKYWQCTANQNLGNHPRPTLRPAWGQERLQHHHHPPAAHHRQPKHRRHCHQHRHRCRCCHHVQSCSSDG